VKSEIISSPVVKFILVSSVLISAENVSHTDVFTHTVRWCTWTIARA